MKTSLRKTPQPCKLQKQPKTGAAACRISPVRAATEAAALRKQTQTELIAAGKRCGELWSECKAHPYDMALFSAYESALEAYYVIFQRAEPERHAQCLARKQQLDAAYPKGFWPAFWQLEGGDTNALELPIRFLENDPWVFRSGYVKADVIRFINRLPLSEEYAQRLRQVVLNVIDRAHGRREFRFYCRLARKVDAPTLRSDLELRLAHADPVVRRQARWALEACRKPS